MLLAIRMLYLGSLWWATRGDPTPRGQVPRAGIPALTASVLLVGAALAFGPTPRANPVVGGALWLAAVIIELGGGYLMPSRHWQISSAKRWTDRYTLIVLIALGQAINSIGVAVVNRPLSTPVMLAIATNAILLSTVWWRYVTTDTPAGAEAMLARRGARLAALARDAYPYLHLPMVAGLVLIAFGLREALATGGRSEGGGRPMWTVTLSG